MSRTVLLCSMVLLLILAGLAGLKGALLALTIPLLIWLFYGLWRGPDRIELEIRREMTSERVSPGIPVSVGMTVTNLGQGIDELVLQDVLAPALVVTDGSNHHLISLGRGQSFKFEYKVSGPRGGFDFHTLYAEAGDHLGLLRLHREFKTPGQLVVMPGFNRIRQVPIRPRRTRVYAGAIPARVGGAGVEFYGVRNYEPGDSSRRINWRVSARHADQLYSNEFQQERVGDVGIVLDGRERANLSAAGESLFEHSVLAAGALADAFLTQGNRVGLLVYSQYLQWTLPAYGKLQRERILHALSQAAPGASQVFDGLQYLPARVFPSESQIVLVSPLLEDDYSTLVQLRARGYQLLVVIPDPVSFETKYLAGGRGKFTRHDVELAARVVRMERSLLIGRIQRAGVQVVEWDVTQPFDQAMRRAVGWRRHMVHRL